jgi:hypothetical protein
MPVHCFSDRHIAVVEEGALDFSKYRIRLGRSACVGLQMGFQFDRLRGLVDEYFEIGNYLVELAIKTHGGGTPLLITETAFDLVSQIDKPVQNC